jgi:hypothetical protein
MDGSRNVLTGFYRCHIVAVSSLALVAGHIKKPPGLPGGLV